MPLHPSLLLLSSRLFTSASRRATALAMRGDRITAKKVTAGAPGRRGSVVE